MFHDPKPVNSNTVDRLIAVIRFKCNDTSISRHSEQTHISLRIILMSCASNALVNLHLQTGAMSENRDIIIYEPYYRN